MTHILHVVGARPNFMKVAPVLAEFDARGIEQTLCHTGQHYDPNLSDIFFEQLEIRRPDISLEVGSGSHAVQTAEVMMRFEKTVEERKPDWVLVYGDVNSTVAAALVCAKQGIKLAHVEAGLRSYDRRMPEEVNRVVTDALADLLLTTSPEAEPNLNKEGVPSEKIHFVGNVMIDTVFRLVSKAKLPEIKGLAEGDAYALLTMHRPSNVDEPETLKRILTTIDEISAELPIVFPIHPRTKSRMDALGHVLADRVLIQEPLGYLECLALQKHARLVLTDSGGLQEESTALGVPCLTIRENTERPITCTEGTNTLIGTDMDLLRSEFAKIMAGNGKDGKQPEKWDGKASQRIADVILGME